MWYVISKQLYIVKLSSYIKEQHKFASFVGVEGGAKTPLWSLQHLSVTTEIHFLMLNISLKYDNPNKLEQYSKVYIKI